MRELKLLSVVIPVYNEQESVAELIKNLRNVLETLSNNYEIIFVNDGSTDGSINILKQAAAVDQKIKIIDLSRNFGKEIALSAGIGAVSGDCVVTLDADLQHPPEIIPKFIGEWQNGFDVVVGVRSSNKSEPLLKGFFAIFAIGLISESLILKIVPQNIPAIMNSVSLIFGVMVAISFSLVWFGKNKKIGFSTENLKDIEPTNFDLNL